MGDGATSAIGNSIWAAFRATSAVRYIVLQKQLKLSTLRNAPPLLFQATSFINFRRFAVAWRPFVPLGATIVTTGLAAAMENITLSERERLDLLRQTDNVFLEVQERLYNSKAQGHPVESKDKCVSMLDTFTVFGSLDDVTELYLNDEKKMVLDFSESRELVLLKTPTKKRPLDRASLRWSLLHSPSRLLAKDQDFCYLEVMKPYGTADGRRGWARCSHSIKHEACPEFSSSQGIDVNRAELVYCGLFFEETDARGVLNATVYYNIKGETIPPVLLPMMLKSRGKRTVELINHYIKMSSTILKSRKTSLTTALRLQGEKRCGACTTQLSLWKPKEKCLMCGSFMCDNCNDIVSRNFRVDSVGRGQVVCFSCAHRRGIKIEPEPETNELASSANSGTAIKTHNSFAEEDHEGGLREGSISSLNDEEIHPKWMDNEAKSSFKQKPPHRHPQRQFPRRNSECTYLLIMPLTRTVFSCLFSLAAVLPHETVYLPSDHAEQQRRRCQSRASIRQLGNAQSRPGNPPPLDEFLELRRRTTTGNSRLSSRAKPTGCAPTRRKKSTHGTDKVAADPMGFAPVGNHVGLNLEEFNWRMRRYTTNSVPVEPIELTDQGRRASARYYTIDGTRPRPRYNKGSKSPSRPASLSFTPDIPQPSSARYSKANPCDLSYLASFK
ncbi:unnamed protein product [Phytophthora fragariaefolia]|uniref:Unnamed protein product n=1 Tax=Phytophthora fragariaefolia TaxID=1490495 RepID=A0A9W7D4B7_9STRA|nr:unnamed protein product [Phytophthora fragariaefolia]